MRVWRQPREDICHQRVTVAPAVRTTPALPMGGVCLSHECVARCQRLLLPDLRTQRLRP